MSLILAQLSTFMYIWNEMSAETAQAAGTLFGASAEEATGSEDGDMAILLFFKKKIVHQKTGPTSSAFENFRSRPSKELPMGCYMSGYWEVTSGRIYVPPSYTFDANTCNWGGFVYLFVYLFAYLDK